VAADPPPPELRIEIDDDDPDFDLLSEREQDEVIHALKVYAKTRQGGTVAHHAPGSIPYDVIRVGRVEIDVRINGAHPKGPTLVVTGFSLAADDSADDY
jgi:hypothetical protein